jgi:FSR family fosmidomycin resistance protein-like MFS transporter
VGVVSLLTLEGSWPVMIIGIAASVVIYFRIKDVPVRPSIQTDNSLGQSWRAMRHVLLPLTGIMLGRGFMAGALTSFLPTLLKSEGQSLWLGGMALALLEFAGAVGALSSGTLSDRLGRRRVLFVAMTTAPLLMLVFSFTSGWLMLPLLVLMGVTAFSTAPVVLAMIQDHAGDHPATANGLYMGISFVINAMLPLLIGQLADMVGLRTAFSWSAIVALTSLPIIYFLPQDE